MKWITREFVHVDRTACPWLIRRFIDSEAEFLFVPADDVLVIAEQDDATPYDIPNVELGHHDDQCSFDAFISKYELTDPALLEVAKVIRAADTDVPELAPESVGLESILNGITMSAIDDHEAIDQTMIVFDGLYADCKIRLLREKYRDELEEKDKRLRRVFLQEKLKEAL